MKRTEIAANHFITEPFRILAEDWMILASGDFGKNQFNIMTIGWGSFGTMWSTPFVMVAVRPQRHTYKFMQECDSFTVSAFPEKYKKALSLCGSKSGKDTDKIKAAGFTPIASSKVKSPGIDEAELIIECRKIYSDGFHPEKFMSPEIEKCYPAKDYHQFYFGEVISIQGTEKYRKSC